MAKARSERECLWGRCTRPRIQDSDWCQRCTSRKARFHEAIARGLRRLGRALSCRERPVHCEYAEWGRDIFGRS